MTLAEAWTLLKQRGPNHVLTDRYGTLISGARAKADEVKWDVVYIRDDGYCLAADIYLAHHAEPIHSGRWIGVIWRGEPFPKALTPIPASSPTQQE